LTSLTITEILLSGIFKGKNIERAVHSRRKLALKLVEFLKIRCELRGEIPKKGTLGVTNHRSYIDSVCIFQYLDACPVVKAEVRKWPLVGFGLVHSGTVFVDRKSKESRRETRTQIADLIIKRISTIVFVEGTTYVGPDAGEFRPGTFMTAAEGDFDVVPIAIEFENEELAWVGESTFIPHFLRIFKKYDEIKVKVAFGEPRKNADWEKLRDDCYDWVNSKLHEMRKEFDQGYFVTTEAKPISSETTG
jgi:1-acyl-sn-glycerol-3-phosphate acyltransferase